MAAPCGRWPLAHEQLNPVDQWRAIERLVALGWTEEAIAVALALPVRQIRKLRLLANVLPAMLEQMAKGDMPNEQQLRTIASASLDEQKEVWKKHKPSKADPQVSWWSVAQGLTKRRMYPNAVLRQVTPDTVAADTVEGTAA